MKLLILTLSVACGHLALGIGEDLDALGDFPEPGCELPSNGLLADDAALIKDPPKIMPHEVGLAFKLRCAKQGKSWISVMRRCERLPSVIAQ